MEEFARAGVSALGYDWPDYGLSSGNPTVKSVYATADAAYRFLTEQLGYPSEDIIVMGYSIGSGPACYLAEKYPVGGLIVFSGPISAPRRIWRAWEFDYPLRPSFASFPNLARISSVSCPKLFIHGTADGYIPFAHAEKLYAKAQNPKQKIWVENANHTNLISVMGSDKFFKTVVAFANQSSR